MAERAHITSIEALEAFRAHLIIFTTTAHRSLDEVGDQVRRMRLWLQNDQRLHWEGELRRRTRAFDEARQELLGARLAGLRNAIANREANVRLARQALAVAETKLRAVKTWNRDYDTSVDPLVKRLQSLRHFLDHDMPKAMAWLVQAQRTLEAYSESAPPPPAPGAAPSTVPSEETT
ncbi:MAG TPA: hypothetical protein VFV83_03860 [Chthoniobacteraceae bacterium]|nr:hypothetical protein [Chthoniobacteraceae bacterium]